MILWANNNEGIVISRRKLIRFFKDGFNLPLEQLYKGPGHPLRVYDVYTWKFAPCPARAFDSTTFGSLRYHSPAKNQYQFLKVD